MRTLTRLILILSTSSLAFSQVAVALNVNARNAAFSAPTNAVAPGSYVALTSNVFPPIGFGSVDGIVVQLLANSFTATLTPLGVPTDRGQDVGPGLWVVIPRQAPAGLATLVLRRENSPIGAALVQIIDTAPGLFTKNYAGFGPALAYAYNRDDNFPDRNELTSAAIPGRPVALFATGIGTAKADDVSVELAGESIPASFAGPQGVPGLDQINFVMPKNPYMGCYVPVAIRVRGILSNTSTLSINPDRYACAHPLGLSYQDLRALDNGDTIPIASVSVLRGQVAELPATESAAFRIILANSDSAYSLAGMQMPDSQYFSCPAVEGDSFFVAFIEDSDAGSITLSGPAGKQLTMPKSPYFADGPTGATPFFTPGLWQISAPGGRDLLGFQQTFTLPPPLASINHTSGDRELRVSWNPTGFTSADIVTVELFDDTVGSVPALRCNAYAFLGQLTFPSSLLQSFAGKPNSRLRVSVGPHPAARTQLTIQRNDGSTIHSFTTNRFTFEIPVKVE